MLRTRIHRRRYTKEAKADIRAIPKHIAINTLTAIHGLATSGAGRLEELKGHGGEMRLRVGDYRVRFTEDDPGTLPFIPSRIARCLLLS